ncbi:hypothetical protein BS099_13925 [Clostridium sporogenes]|uniref:Uncharacterized protein n=1 Tax=Clostridium botulinum B2 450 TaxID=1379739 RepID=A0A0D1BX93_CLOBO|nr:hypothetical protein CLSPOx_09690 [Clostridium sporogenes]KIS24985.1 hypothetical protein N495_09745 [Clostridium botulinum B2 450]OOO65931.1 hypothetical protein BS099_13925 [Clostridium sporogenes]
MFLLKFLTSIILFISKSSLSFLCTFILKDNFKDFIKIRKIFILYIPTNCSSFY